MPAISAGDLALLRGSGHQLKLYASILQPRTLWSARVNDAGISRSEQTIIFNTGAGANFPQVEAHQTVWVGTTAGAHDVGKARIKSIASGDAGVTGTLVVGSNGINWADTNHLTFMHNYEMWACFPRIDSNEVFYKDFDIDGGITYTDENEDINPVTIAGPHQAGFLVAGTISFDIPIGDSYAMAPGAAIAGQSVTVFPAVGVTVNAIAAGIITVDYTVAGQYWVKCTSTDDNGKSQVTFRSHFVHDNLSSSSDYPAVDIQSVRVSGAWDKGGWSAGIKVGDNASFTDYPNDSLAIIWQDATYGSTQKDISLFDEGTNIIICGYLQKDKISKAQIAGGEVDFEIATIEAVMKQHFMFSVSVESVAAPSEWYEYIDTSLTAGHILHYIYRWHSTLIFIADFIDLDDDDGTKRFAADLNKGNLYAMGDDLVRNRGIFAHIASDKSGRLRMARDLTYRTDAVRLAATVIATIDKADTTDPVTIVHNPIPRTSFVFASGIFFDGVTAFPLGATAPGATPAPFGPSDTYIERQMLTGQLNANQLAGQIFAIQNNEFPEVRTRLRGNYLGVLEPAIQEWWEIDIATGDTIREFVWADQRLLLRSVTANINLADGTIECEAVFETEVDGTDGIIYLWPTTIPGGVGGGDPEVPDNDPDPIGGGGGSTPGAIMTSASLNYLPYSLSSWKVRTNDSINDAGQDPYWRTAAKQNSTDPRLAIVYTAENGQIRKTLDSGITLTLQTPGNPPNDAGDAPAPVLADVDFIQMDANSLVDGQIEFIGRWLNGGGEWRSWILLTSDDGTGWSWESVL